MRSRRHRPPATMADLLRRHVDPDRLDGRGCDLQLDRPQQLQFPGTEPVNRQRDHQRLRHLQCHRNCQWLHLDIGHDRGHGQCDSCGPTVSNNGPICSGGTLTLTASSVSGATYSWTGPNSFTSTNRISSVVSATTNATGSYSVTLTLNGCTSTSATTIATVNAAPAAPTVGNNGPVCSGGTLTLTASTIAGATYSWTGPIVSLPPRRIPLSPTQPECFGYLQRHGNCQCCTSTSATTSATVNLTRPHRPSATTGPSARAVH